MLAVPSFDVLAAFTAACAVLIITPGPDMALFLGNTFNQGRRAGLVTVFGAMTGQTIHSLLAALGLSVLLAASPVAFDALKLAGAAYLLWLAWQTVRHRGGIVVNHTPPSPRSFARLYATGLLINLLNPKVVLFFVTVLPQFVASNDPAATGRLLFLGLYFVGLAAPSCAAIVLAADRIARLLRGSPKLKRGIDWLFAGVMGAFALKLLSVRAVGAP